MPVFDSKNEKHVLFIANLSIYGYNYAKKNINYLN